MDLHFIAPQFLAWFYPANGEIFHAVGMLAFGRDLLSPLLNLGWFVGCLVACWCIGRPYRVAPWSLVLGAVALSVPALADQAGEARNDIVGIFFLLAAVAIALNAWAARDEGERGLSTGALAVVGLGGGLGGGNQAQLPAAGGRAGRRAGRDRAAGRQVAGARGRRPGGAGRRRLLVPAQPRPQPATRCPGSTTSARSRCPRPSRRLGGREAHSVLGYLTDGAVWSDWFLPGLHARPLDRLAAARPPPPWPASSSASLPGLGCAVRIHGSRRERNHAMRGREGVGPVLALAGLVGLATALAWLVAPTSASGPDGMPRGFESGLRYLAPALVLGLALLPATPLLRGSPRAPRRAAYALLSPHSGYKASYGGRIGARGGAGAGVALVLLAVAIGYPVQRHYLQSRYADPTFTTPGLNAAFDWAGGISDARIATTSTRQYPLFGTDLSNHVQFIGAETPPRRLRGPDHLPHLAPGAERGPLRLRSHHPRPPRTRPAAHTHRRPAGPKAPEPKPILRKPPTVVFQLRKLDPSACPDESSRGCAGVSRAAVRRRVSS